MAVTIKDVARETNLAISTISKYMNGGAVREANKKIIDEAVKKLGYHPNKAARGLKSSKTYMIGLLLDGMESQYFSIITEHIEKLLKANGYSMIVCCHRDDAKKAKKAVEFLARQHVDGILALSIQGDADLIEEMNQMGIPFIALDRTPRGVLCDSVSSNAAVGAYEAVEYLVSQGHEKIGLITGTDTSNPGLLAGEERLRGYLRVHEDYGMHLRQEYIRVGNFKFESGYRCMEELWALSEKPTAVFVCNYNMTLGAVTAIHNMKIKMPLQLSMAAFDDLEFSLLSRPRLTAVRQPAEEIARESVELLLRRISGDMVDFPKQIKLPTAFTVRESVRKIK